MLIGDWKDLRDELKRQIDVGQYPPSEPFPSEKTLMNDYQVGRYTVRRAIDSLASDGRLEVVQGRGAFVNESFTLTYEISGRTRLRENLADQVYRVGNGPADHKIIAADDTLAGKLNIEVGEDVTASTRKAWVKYRESSCAVPIAYGTTYHSNKMIPNYADYLDKYDSVSSVYEALGLDYSRKETDVVSRSATLIDAKALKQHSSLAVTVVKAIDVTSSDHPICYSETVWASSRVCFKIRS